MQLTTRLTCPHKLWSIIGLMLLSSHFSLAALPPDPATAAQKIDTLVLEQLQKKKIQPNAIASDETFVRRVYLDTIGRIPSIKETRHFLADKAPDKRAQLIDHLLASEGYMQHHFNFWADILRLKSTPVGNLQSLPGGLAYADWLKQSLLSNKPYDQMVRELVTAEGTTYDNGAIGFYLRDYNMQLDNMAVTTQIFLGTQMVCAQCHDHPFDKWSMMDYYQMAAHTNGIISTNNLPDRNLAAGYGKKNAKNGADRLMLNKAFTEILRPLRFNRVLHIERALRLPHDYQYSDAKPLSVVPPAIPASFSKTGTVEAPESTPPEQYAAWMTSPENPRFTLVIANRLWKKLLGQGVIEPVDELTDSTVPSNPALMSYLEQLMKDLNYDMKAFQRIILNSQTYQREAHNAELALGEIYDFPGPLLRRMSAEQIWDSMLTLYKNAPDQRSSKNQLETATSIARVRWLDQSLKALSPAELIDGAKQVAQKQKELAEEVRKAQEALAAANEAGDEDAIRQAKRQVSSQRSRINETVEAVVYEMGFQKLLTLAHSGQLEAQAGSTLAAEMQQVLAKAGDKDLTLDRALSILQRERRARIESKLNVQRERLLKNLQIGKKQMNAFNRYFSSCQETMIRAADVRSPAPLGHFLREFGQADRELIESANREATIGQALIMLNGSLFEELLSPFSVISRTLQRQDDPDTLIDHLYLSLLSRTATAREKAMLTPILEPRTDAAKAEALWTLLNTKQFLFIPKTPPPQPPPTPQ
jgi:hypothetical protein